MDDHHAQISKHSGALICKTFFSGFKNKRESFLDSSQERSLIKSGPQSCNILMFDSRNAYVPAFTDDCHYLMHDYSFDLPWCS